MEITRMSVDRIAAFLASGNVTPEIIEEIKADKRSTVARLIESWQRRRKDLDKENERLKLLFEYERGFQQKGYHLIAGVDEAGRGPLAGPVVTAAVILPLDCKLNGINDSKKLSAKQRENLFRAISDTALAVCYTEVDVETIDKFNIYQATILGMYQSLRDLQVEPDAVLIDAVPLRKLAIPNLSIIKGDALSASIAAASIVAKVKRDRLMDELDKEYPQYGFSRHKGYGTKEHIDALKKYGPCPVHRRSFAPIKTWGTLFDED
ncbi:MAG: Ribonuclease [Firmicutes bacterium]|nr:Ribonuclease [Bacillota bacterium]